MLLLSLRGSILQGYMYLFRESYINELFISFLPYAIGINFLLLLFSCYKTLYNYKRKNIFLTIIWAILSTMYIGHNRIYISEYRHTYTNILDQNSNISMSQSEGLSFLYANIYYKNENFSGLLSTIEDHQPDILLLVEYAKIHDENLAPLLKAKYPYVSRYVGGEGYDGDVIYSRYPLTKIKHSIYPGSFSHVNVKYNNKNIDLALIHTSAPVSESFFTMRNKQLDDLSNLMIEYYSRRIEQKVILLGDFNVTPRSVYYKSFKNDMTDIKLYDITNNLSVTDYTNTLPYTWCHEFIPIMCAHIDHIRTNIPIQLQKISIPGSDHYGFVGTI